MAIAFWEKGMLCYAGRDMPARKKVKPKTPKKPPKVRDSAIPSAFRRLEVVSLKDQVLNAIKDAFFEGQLKPGSPIVDFHK